MSFWSWLRGIFSSKGSTDRPGGSGGGGKQNTGHDPAPPEPPGQTQGGGNEKIIVEPPTAQPPGGDNEQSPPTPVEAAKASLDPVTPAIPLSAALQARVKCADEVLSVAKINEVPSWNLFLTGNKDAKPFPPQAFAPLINGTGAYAKPNELFDAKTIIPVKQIFGGYLAKQPVPKDSDTEEAKQAHANLTALAAALPSASLLRRPAHKFNIDGRLDTRIVFFGGMEPDNKPDIDALMAELGGQHMRVILQWSYYAKDSLSHSPQGGTPVDILGNAYMPAGSSHISGLSTGIIDGKPVTVQSNWGDQTAIDDYIKNYRLMHLLAIDYQAGVRDPVPDDTLAAWKHNADLWDCFAAMIVPFTSQTDAFGYERYTWNPLELHDQASARDLSATLAHLDWPTLQKKCSSFYCAEAQYTVANLGPQEYSLVKKSLFGSTRAGRLIEKFGTAPGYQGKDIAWCRQHPELGWEWLLNEGKDKGGISIEEYRALATDGTIDAYQKTTYSNRQGLFLEFLPEHIKGWQAYRPRNSEGLIATPLTAGTTAWSLIRCYLPREEIARTIVTELLSAHQTGGENVKAAVKALTGGLEPVSAAGQQALGHIAMMLASGMLLEALSDKEGLDPDDNDYSSVAQKMIFHKAGYEEITSQEDKDKVKKLWQEFLAVIQHPDNNTQDRLDAAFLKVDREAAALRVDRAPLKEGAPGYTSLMRFVPPGCWAMWAQQPFYSEAYTIRYVASAIHNQFAKAAA